MLETQIKILATLYTALLMTAVIYVLLFQGFTIKSPQVKGQAIQAIMVDVSQLKAKKTSKQIEKPIAKKDLPKPQPPKPEQQPPKEQAPKVKQEPIKKEPPVIVKKTPVVDTKAQELERQKSQQRQKDLVEIRKKREEAEKRAKQEQQNLIDLANKTQQTETTEVQQNSSTVQGQSETDKRNQLMTQYQLAVISSVTRQWNKPASANENLICHVKVRQIPGGGVIDATISSPCNANTIVKNSIIAAIKKADPLPYKGFESVFSRTATFIFQPSKD